VGCKNVKITTSDVYGNDSCNVVIVYATKFTSRSLTQFYVQYGVYAAIISDLSCDLISEAVAHLNRWIGLRHTFSLVDHHESNERTNKELRRHPRALCADEHVKTHWSSPENLGLVQYIWY
jgi:hypothetical protein